MNPLAHRRVLVVLRAPGRALAGAWEFPGGKVEPGESLQECLVRELMEELGLRTRIGDIVTTSEYHYAHGSIQLVAMNATVLGGTVRLTVHDEVKWLLPADVAALPLAPADIPIAAKLVELDDTGACKSD